MSLLGFLRRARSRGPEVTVVGSGLPALAVALELAQRGCRVTVLGPAGSGERPVGLGLALLGPGLPYDQVVATLGHDDARTLWAAGRENLGRLRALLAAIGRDCAFEARGSFLLAANRREARSLAKSEDMLRDDGFSGEFLDHYMLETRFDIFGTAGAYWAAEGAQIDAALLARTLAKTARSAGATFRSGPVRGLEIGARETSVHTDEASFAAQSLVLATDGAVRSLLPGLHPPPLPAAPERLRIQPQAGATLPTVARTADGRAAWQADASGITLAATGVARPRETPPGAEIEDLAQRLHATPGSERRWTEEGEVAPDTLPIVGTAGHPHLAVACGFGPLAASFVFAAAHWIAEGLLTGRDPTPGPLRAGRESVPAVV